MRISLHTKILLGYLLFGLLGFLTITLFSSGRTLRYLEKKQGEKLYEEACQLAEDCREMYRGKELGLSDFRNHFDPISRYMDASLWIVRLDGTVSYTSDQVRSIGIVLEDFEPAGEKGKHYRIGYGYSSYDHSVMTVTAPISANFSTYGYVVLHEDMAVINQLQNQLVVIMYITLGILFVISLIILVIIQITIFRPMKKIEAAARAYAAGNLTYELKVHSEDEIGYLAAALSAMAKDLSTKEADQKKFISNVSHDFRSPLTSIKGYLEAMLDGTIPPEMHEKYMRRVISETERLTKLTSSTLALQTLDSRGNMLDITNFDLNQVIRDSAAAFESICRPKGIQFDLIFANKTALVSADQSKIQQVIYNLFDNAIKFSNPSGKIWVETYERQNKIFVSVKDQGCGIPRESQKKIWERFYKSDSSRGKDRTGTGLGLAITKEIMTAHHENIDVISTEGIGSEFIFSLPKAKPQSP